MGPANKFQDGQGAGLDKEGSQVDHSNSLSRYTLYVHDDSCNEPSKACNPGLFRQVAFLCISLISNKV